MLHPFELLVSVLFAAICLELIAPVRNTVNINGAISNRYYLSLNQHCRSVLRHMSQCTCSGFTCFSFYHLYRWFGLPVSALPHFAPVCAVSFFQPKGLRRRPYGESRLRTPEFEGKRRRGLEGNARHLAHHALPACSTVAIRDNPTI